MSDVQSIAQGASQKMTERTKSMLTTVQNWPLVHNYIAPLCNYILSMFYRSPLLVKLSALAFMGMSAIPVGCFLGFMSMVSVGCAIVGGFVFTIVEGAFTVFASVFLLPALGVAFLMASGVGLFSLVGYTCYLITMYLIGLIRSPGAQRQVQQKVDDMSERTREKAPKVVGHGAQQSTF
ncbi:hypothetical protein BG011_000624 [Mortierella polycephala]|uniref:Uncharacterized protein n=1 Tax=Mortierella polycephala TaxID=41804 RepID=A0A9P6PL25_9FUNG|nr:hypothetical protein BG011_000624 [Mortierella polycephala]